jgi:hypothetical protein
MIPFVLVAAMGVGELDHSKKGSEADAPYCYDMYACMVGDEEGDMLSPFMGWEVEKHPTFHHTYCLVCGWDDGVGGICHWECFPEGADSGSHESLRIHLETWDAFAAGDLERILEASAESTLHLEWNANRRAIQMLNCDGSAVVASLGLVDEESRLIERVAAALD